MNVLFQVKEHEDNCFFKCMNSYGIQYIATYVAKSGRLGNPDMIMIKAHLIMKIFLHVFIALACSIKV